MKPRPLSATSDDEKTVKTPRRRKKRWRTAARKFHGNQFKSSVKKKQRSSSSSASRVSETASPTYRKLQSSCTEDEAEETTSWSGYRILHRDLLFKSVSDFCRCVCGGAVRITEVPILGLYSEYQFSCEVCDKILERTKMSSIVQGRSKNNLIQVSCSNKSI